MRPHPRSLAAPLLLLALPLALGGCTRTDGLTLGEVSGTVTADGQPVRYGFVTFQPKGDGPPAMGTINKDGTYSLTTGEPDDGAVVGEHGVAIIALDPDPIREEDVVDPTEDPKKFMMTKGGTAPEARKKKEDNVFKSRDGKVYKMIAPAALRDPGTSNVSAKVEAGSNRINLAIQPDGTVQVQK